MPLKLNILSVLLLDFALLAGFFWFCIDIVISEYRRIKRNQRWTMGLCVSCEYDLRYTQAVCPECGLKNDIALRKKYINAAVQRSVTSALQGMIK